MKFNSRIKFLAAGALVLLILAIASLKWSQNQSKVSSASPGQSRLATSSSIAADSVVRPPALPEEPPASAPGSTASAPLPVPQGTPWAAAANEPAFAAFADWARQYQDAGDATAKAALAEEGRVLANKRRAAMFSLIQTNPKRAIELAVPLAVRQELPGAITDLLEERVSGRGNLNVLCVLPEAGQEDNIAPRLDRSANINGKNYQAYLYGAREEAITKRDIPLNGVAIDNVMAVNENPFRPLEASEMARLNPAELTRCSHSSHPLGNEAGIAVELGNQAQVLCQHHLAQWTEDLQLAALEPGSLAGPTSIAGRTYTEGRKRVIIFRVAFANVPEPQLTEARAIELIDGSSDFFQQNSYGRTTLAKAGEGSDVVLVTLPVDSSTYDDQAGPLQDDARQAAEDGGIDLSKYDFDITATGSTPAFGWAGLGWVGAPGLWIRSGGNFSVGVTVHELGHNFGLPHGNFWDTGGQSTIGPGENQEYGDSYDNMGGGGADRGHYCAKFKWRLGWIPDGDYPRVSSSGRYRVYAQDNPDSRGARGLRVRHDSSQDWSLEFRQLYADIPWFMDGLGLRWGSASGSGSQLIDTTPGTRDNKNDSPIVIGQTFSDLLSDVHITPLGKGNTYPESMDVQVNIGPFPGNLPPTVVVRAAVNSADAGATLSFSADASDPNADALAYHWDFGDQNFGLNQATTSHSWSGAGDYVVQCTVTDMKGGTASDSIVVSIGSASEYTISGRVLNGLQPVAGVLVKASSTRYAYTDSDGTYTITRLGAGSYELSATLHPYLFARPWFSSPVTVSPNAANKDFIMVEQAVEDAVLVAKGSVWKYLDNGSDQGTAWRATGFDDDTWPSGPAELGYGDDDEATVVSFGPDPDNKYPTTYFRHAFTVEDPASLTNLNLEWYRDDGGVVYLNGNEVLRDNMTSGAISYTTYASGNSDTTTQTGLNVSSLAPGLNVIAAEVHQANATSSDISFDLSLSATTATNFDGLATFYIATPANHQVFPPGALVAITVNAFNNGGAYTNAEFFVDGVKVADDGVAPFGHLAFSLPAGDHTIGARITDDRGVAAFAAPVHISLKEPPPIPETIQLIAEGAVWKYLDNGTDQGAAWTQPAFDDNGWSAGAAQLGYGDGDEVTAISSGSNPSDKHPTTYFRHTFQVEDLSDIATLSLRLLRDDGGIVYLNGTEVFRSQMPQDPVDYRAYASGIAGGDEESQFFGTSIDPALLIGGGNVVAVEIHQANASSSDLSFDFALDAIRPSRERGVVLTNPLDDSVHDAPANPILAAVATPASGLTITRVEFFNGNNSLGGDLTAPFRLDWNNAPIGSHTLTARAYESGGAILTSAPVAITVSAPPNPRQLIAQGARWNYWDDGAAPANDWMNLSFNDGDWLSGNAKFGYGDDGEITRIRSGPDSNRKHITAYFRHRFTVPDATGISRLLLRLQRDDGAVVYLNGAEIHRSNLQPGPISPNSLALATVSVDEETTFLETLLDASSLHSGNNLLAVEVHQQSITSSDLGFDLELIGLADTNLTLGIYLTSPGNNATITLPASVPLRAYAVAAGEVTLVEYYDGDSKIGEATAAPYEVSWNPPSAGMHSLTAQANYDGGSIMASPALLVTVQDAPTLVEAIGETLVPTGATWKYWATGTDPGFRWKNPSASDAAWPTGPARFGYGLDGEVTSVPEGAITTYYRHWFTVENPALLSALLLQIQRDDGAVVYLNGTEIFRTSMPPGPVHYGTLALSTANGLDEQFYFEGLVPTDGSGLLAGTNLLAVEIHQSSPDSSDMGFDLELTGLGSTDRRAYLASPGPLTYLPVSFDALRLAQANAGSGAAALAPGDVLLEAYANAGADATITKVEFFADGTKLGEANAAPYAFTWTQPAIGRYAITVVATDNHNETIASAPVNVAVGYESVANQVIAAGALWKYLDNGTDPGTAWTQADYSDTAWSSGLARLGYGNDGERTTVSFGPSSANKYITTYFRHVFTVPETILITDLTFRLQRDDGAVVYLNGAEVFRSNLPEGPIDSRALAAGTTGSEDETAWFAHITAMPLVEGLNVVAVEVHQADAGSSDLGFDLELIGAGLQAQEPPPQLTIQNIASRRYLVSWPVSNLEWTLYSSSSPAPGSAWSVAGSPASVVQSNGMNQVSYFGLFSQRYFRLQR